MKKLLIFLVFLPSLAFADRLGGINSSVDVLLATQIANGAVLNNNNVHLGNGISNAYTYGLVITNGGQSTLANGDADLTLSPGTGANATLTGDVITLSGNQASLPANTQVNSKAVCLQDGTNCPASGAGTPGGSNTQVQYNNSSAFGGMTAMTYYSSSNTITISSYTELTKVSTVTATDSVWQLSRSSMTIGQTNFVSTSTTFQVGTSTTMAWNATDGHFEFHATTTPTLSSCGTNPTIAVWSSDTTGTFTLGSSASATCTLTFSNVWKNTPQCFANDETSIVGVRVQPTTSNVVFTVPGISSDKIDYFCVGQH